MGARVFLLILVCSSALGQYNPHYNPRNNQPLIRTKTYLVLFNLGADFADNQSLNNWLNQNGTNSIGNPAFSYGVKALISGKGKLIFGGEIMKATSHDRDKTDYYFCGLFAMLFQLKHFYAHPMIGLGINTSDISFQDKIPPQLTALNVPIGDIHQNSGLVKPSILIVKGFNNSFFTIGLELGVKVAFLQSDWVYVFNGTHQKITLSDIPNASQFQPYISFVFGFDAGN